MFSPFHDVITEFERVFLHAMEYIYARCAKSPFVWRNVWCYLAFELIFVSFALTHQEVREYCFNVIILETDYYS